MSTDQFDLETYVRDHAERARDHGTDVALAMAGDWRRVASEAVEHLAVSGRLFSAEDVRRIAGDPPSDNAMGAVFLAASKPGRIVPAGFRRSSRSARRGGLVRIWVGAGVVVDRGS